MAENCPVQQMKSNAANLEKTLFFLLLEEICYLVTLTHFFGGTECNFLQVKIKDCFTKVFSILRFLCVRTIPRHGGSSADGVDPRGHYI